MLLIKTEVKPSKIHGLGLFALEPIKVGDIVGIFDPYYDRVFSEEKLI